MDKTITGDSLDKKNDMSIELQKIVDYLILNSQYMRNIGLFHGKMGIVVALYAYAYKYNDKLLEDYAWDLFQQVYDSVHSDLPIGLEYGLIGIGYGTTMMCEQGWVKCDPNDILADIDAKIMEHDPRRITDFSVRTGAGGLCLYLALRQRTNGLLSTFDKQFLSELQSTMLNRETIVPVSNIVEILNEPPFAIDDYIEKPIGIDAGSAFYILKHVLA